MFTGIVQGVAPIIAISGSRTLRRHTLRLPPALLPGLEPGASVAHNGCCLTVVAIEGDAVSFELMQVTLETTNLGALQVGEAVNVERAARFGDEIGGHAMSGHIMATAPVVEVIRGGDNHRLWIEPPPTVRRYLFDKGYVGVDGVSLTVAEVTPERFAVSLIPETLARTTLGERGVGSRVNIEVDPQTQAVVDTVERVLAQRGL